MNLVRDGYLAFVRQLISSFSVGIDPDKAYRLTNNGRDFIQNGAALLMECYTRLSI
jgi:hypothetical protein